MSYSHTNSKGQLYYLHMQDVTLKGGRLQRIYFFRKVCKEGAVDVLPAGFMVVENPKTGLPVLKKG